MSIHALPHMEFGRIGSVLGLALAVIAMNARAAGPADGAAKKSDGVDAPAVDYQPVPKPKLKPIGARSRARSSQAEPSPQSKPSAVVVSPHAADSALTAGGTARCRNELLELGVNFSVPERVEGTGACRVIDPVQLRSLSSSGGQVTLPGSPLLNCEFARQFSVWVSDVAAPIVAALGGAQLESLSTGPGYECRTRTGDTSGKISEHALGNAVDIDGIVLKNAQRIEIPDVADKENVNHRMLMALRISACGYFTTVLGPGADAAHASHFHFDLGLHGKSGKYRICE
jgi:hypothetical protein